MIIRYNRLLLWIFFVSLIFVLQVAFQCDEVIEEKNTESDIKSITFSGDNTIYEFDFVGKTVSVNSKQDDKPFVITSSEDTLQIGGSTYGYKSESKTDGYLITITVPMDSPPPAQFILDDLQLPEGATSNRSKGTYSIVGAKISLSITSEDKEQKTNYEIAFENAPRIGNGLTSISADMEIGGKSYSVSTDNISGSIVEMRLPEGFVDIPSSFKSVMVATEEDVTSSIASDTPVILETVGTDEKGFKFSLENKYGDKKDVTVRVKENPVLFSLKLTFKWTAQSHGALPTSPSPSFFAPFVCIHNGEFLIFQEGKLARTEQDPTNTSEVSALESLAEEGANGDLNNLARGSGHVYQTYARSNVGPMSTLYMGSVNTGEMGTFIEATVDSFYVGIASMIAPSPDWFVGDASISLKNADGTFKDLIEGEMKAYDAGTEEGSRFSQNNDATDPEQNVAELKSFPDGTLLTASNRLVSYTIEKKTRSN